MKAGAAPHIRKLRIGFTPKFSYIWVNGSPVFLIKKRIRAVLLRGKSSQKWAVFQLVIW